ncbi:MAG: hypothetical protein M1829_004043 [Trizodia sp. TS-e1964]|nr:MAG: hypothetical protein M1829_004043 [Trizodia sp. TS-e1964]
MPPPLRLHLLRSTTRPLHPPTPTYALLSSHSQHGTSTASPPSLRALARPASTTSHEPESPYNPPGGWLWGVPPGTKPEKEGWETVWIYGFFGSLAFGVVMYAFKPDTSIQTWALEEARRRLEVEGILPDPDVEVGAREGK